MIRIAFFIVLFTVNAYGQSDTSVISIEGAVTSPLQLSIKDLEKFPSAELKAKVKEGKEHTYKGVALAVLLDSAGVTLGKELRGANLLKYVLVTAKDNYNVVYSLAEIDLKFTSGTVLLATQVDEKPLPKGEGRFRIVNPTDKNLADG
jgi:DMSO/TMAO reductase YedYZ molybdopterin-dependent catalytic subunit